MIVPMVLSDRGAAFRIAVVCTISSVLGGLAGYAIGYFFYDTIGARIVEFYGYAGKFEEFPRDLCRIRCLDRGDGGPDAVSL